MLSDIDLLARKLRVVPDDLMTGAVGDYLTGQLAAEVRTLELRLCDDLWQRLTERAAAAGRSVEMEVVAILDGSLS